MSLFISVSAFLYHCEYMCTVCVMYSELITKGKVFVRL